MAKLLVSTLAVLGVAALFVATVAAVEVRRKTTTTKKKKSS